MKKIIRIAGRFSVLALTVMITEALFTFGTAFEWYNYGAAAWIFQSLLFVLCVWGALEWQDGVDQQNK